MSLGGFFHVSYPGTSVGAQVQFSPAHPLCL